MTLRPLSCLLALTGLLLVLTACTEASAAQAEPSPTVKTSTSIPTATEAPSPTPFGGTFAQLGPLPKTCPAGAISRLKPISSQFGLAAGAGPAWAIGISSHNQDSLALVWIGEDTSDHTQYGWGHTLLWVVATPVQGAVTIHGVNLQTGAPVSPDAEYAEPSSTPTALILNPNDPAVVSQNSNRDDQWTQFPGGLTIPGAGCYGLSATWPGGSWHLTFAAGRQ